MTPEEKVNELLDKHDKFWIQDWQWVIQTAIITVEEIISALNDYGNRTMELQNMDRELEHWNKVKEELESRLKIEKS